MRYLEDFAVGQKFGSATLRVEEERVKRFAAEFDPQPFHLDDAAARATLFGGLAASGWHTAALTMRMLVEAMPLADGLVGAELELAWWRSALDLSCGATAVEPDDLDMQALELHSHRVE